MNSQPITSIQPRHGADDDWYITKRWFQYYAEGRINLLRTVCISVFYVIHLLNYAGSNGRLPQLGFLQWDVAAVSVRLHLLITLIVGTWLLVALTILLSLARQTFPSWLGTVVTIVDTIMLTAIAYLADGPRSPLIAGYVLIIVCSAMRLDLNMIRVSTLSAIVGYITLLGVAKWPAAFGKEGIDLTVPRHSQLIFIAALALVGVVLGQLIRLVPRMARYYAGRVRQAEARND